VDPFSSPFSYAPVGMTARPGGLPPDGFRQLRLQVRLGHGPEVYEAARRALFGWHMHRGVPLGITATAPEAAPGVRVTLRIGPVRAPCQVVWTRREPTHAGFAYGTLPGHPECGEEAFLLDLRPDGTVDFTVFALSRPAAWYARAAGPVTPWVQRAAAHRYATVLRRLSRGPRRQPAGRTGPS
jgi:uncharacterized protein (UPF0548 family)